jgi:hypothetical protein
VKIRDARSLTCPPPIHDTVMVVSVSLSISEFKELEEAESMSRENSAAPFADRMPFLILSGIRRKS